MPVRRVLYGLPPPAIMKRTARVRQYPDGPNQNHPLTRKGQVMATGHPTRRRLVGVVGYVRRSTQKQEKSLADQRREIERYAARHGYTILRWFEDDGISGDATEKRTAFQAMHREATNGRDFDIILCWDQDRFGRFNSIEAGYWIHPLMKAGVRLETVTEGPINWDDFAGRIVHAVKQEGKHQFLLDLSRNTARGQVTAAMNGWLTGRAAPYGYDRMLVDEAGNHRQRVHNGEQFAKSRAWHVTLVPSDDPEKVRVAKWLFTTYAQEDVGLRELVNRLNGQGIPGPRGGYWNLGTIRDILKNETYAGDFIWPKRNLGKYHRVSGTEIKPRNGSGSSVKFTDEAERINHKGILPALVDRETFKRVQRKLTERKKRTTPHKQKDGDKYLLSGVIHCAHCGAKMYGQRSTRRKNGKTYTWERYVCSSYHTKGHHVCGHHTVDQAALLSLLLGKLRQAVLVGGREGLRDQVLTVMRKRQKGTTGEADALRSRLADLDKQLAQGAKRLIAAPDDIADLLGAELSKLRKERDRLADRLTEARPIRRDDLEAQADALVDRLWTLTQELGEAPPPRLREIVRRMVSRIDLRFRQEKWGRKTVSRFDAGEIVLRPDSDLYKLVSRGDWI